METYKNENDSQESKSYTEENSESKSVQEIKEQNDDFHKNDNLCHGKEEEKALENLGKERIDNSGTDPNRYENLASQDTGSIKSMYNDEDNEDYDAEDISDKEFSDEEEELKDNEANRFKIDSNSKNDSPEEPLSIKGI